MVLLHVAVWPLVYRLFDRLPDRGHSVGRVIGILLVSWFSWIGWALGFWQAGSLMAWACLLAVGVVSWWLATNAKAGLGYAAPFRWVTANLRTILPFEVLFLAGFLLEAGLRGLLPGILHSEQPSDFMVLNSLWRSRDFPAQDAWLAGFPISYYYFGYWMQTVVAWLADVPPRWSFNLGLGTLYALLAGAVYGVGFNLAAGGQSAEKVRLRRAILLGWFTAGAVCLAGNLRSVYDLVRYSWDRSNWWWFSSRAILDEFPVGTSRYDITEFPAFSFLLGDNHPHLHSAPCLLVTATLGLQVLLRRRSGRGGNERGLLTWMERLGAGLIVAVLLMTNSWDLAPTLLLLSALVGFAGLTFSEAASPRRRTLVVKVTQEVALTLGLALLFCAPHFSTADARVFGLLPNALFPTSLDQAVAASGAAWGGLGLLLMAGWKRAWTAPVTRCFLASLLMVVLYLACSGFWLQYSNRGTEWLRFLGLLDPASIWGEMLHRHLAAPFVLLALLTGIHWSIGRLGKSGPCCSPERAFVIILFAAGCGLLLVPELVFLHDVFGYRVNTVFKTHFAAWLLLGLAGSAALFLWRFRGLLRRLRQGILILFGLTLLYPVAGWMTRLRTEAKAGFSWDVLAPLQVSRPEFTRLLAWMEANLQPGTILLEAPGHRDESGSSRLSSLTGYPVPVGWIDHELQWRSGRAMESLLESRTSRVAAVYRSVNRDGLLESLEPLGASVVYVGPRETEIYGIAESESVFDRYCETLFREGPERLYSCRAGLEGSGEP